MSLFTQCCSGDVSVAICGSSVKKHGKLGDVLDNMQRKLCFTHLSFQLGRSAICGPEFWTNGCSCWAVWAGFCLPWNGDGTENRISVLLLQTSSHPFSLNLNKICFSFSRRCPICHACAEAKLPQSSTQWKSFCNFMVCQTPNLIDLDLKKFDTKELLEIQILCCVYLQHAIQLKAPNVSGQAHRSS